MFDKKSIEALSMAEKEWDRRYPENDKSYVTPEGIRKKRVYTPNDLEDKRINYLRDIGLPGEFPFTRGNEPSMYRTKPIVNMVFI